MFHPLFSSSGAEEPAIESIWNEAVVRNSSRMIVDCLIKSNRQSREFSIAPD